MNSGAFGYVDVLKTAADASWLREEVLTNNNCKCGYTKL